MSVTAVPIRPLSRGSVLKLWLGLLVFALAAAGLAWAGTRAQQRETLPSGVQIQVIEEGEGDPVTPADLVALRYRLTKTDGSLIQDSDQTGQPFVTSTEGLFPGFSEALQRMRSGGRYKIWLPPGQHVQGPLPPGAPFTPEDTLVFNIEILQIAPGMAAMQRMMGPPGAGGAAPGGAPPSSPPAESGAPGAAEGGAPAELPPEPPAGNSQR
ncbi:MAG TPA: FKBP-type peptidyl-prolyl cis-trans isomerase [Allosphingosinicella sp.]|nr:FKBP-type peptidyl-prolyl cis-trans isomerase [Allosphingosinicella sp.]